MTLQTLREMINKLKDNHIGYQIHVCDTDGYLCMSFVLNSDTDCDDFSGIYDEQILDSRVMNCLIWDDDMTIDIYTDIEL